MPASCIRARPPFRPRASSYASAMASIERGGSIAERLALAPEVAAAIRDGRPVVALESTLISHGLPPPRHLEGALAAETAVRSRGVVPAPVAVPAGRIIVRVDPGGLGGRAKPPAGV